MIVKVNWQFLILAVDDSGGYSGYRVAKRIQAGNPPVNPPNGKGTDFPHGNNWGRQADSISYNNKNYICAFWSLTGQDSITAQTFAIVQPDSNANYSISGGLWTITATAYYVWDVINAGGIGGDNEVLIDAFDIQAAAFIPDDFVDVAPDDQNKTLTNDANNNGYLDTTTQIAQGDQIQIKITARDLLGSNKKFGHWQKVSEEFFSSNPKTPATIGSPDAHDIVAHYNDVVVAFAFYNEPPPLKVVYGVYPILVWAMSDAGQVLVPLGSGGGPIGPDNPMSTLATTVRLLQDANLVSVELRKAILAGAEKMALQAVKEIQNQLKQ